MKPFEDAYYPSLMEFLDQDDARWVAFLFRITLLRFKGYNGAFWFEMDQGRVRRRTMHHLERLTRPIVEEFQQEEAGCPQTR